MWLVGQGTEVTGGQQAGVGLVHGVDTRISIKCTSQEAPYTSINRGRLCGWRLHS